MKKFEIEERGEVIGEPIEADSLEKAQAEALLVHGIVITEMTDPAYNKWLEKEKDRLLEDYEFDVHEAVNVNGDIEKILNFTDFARAVYEQELEDGEYDRKEILCGNCSRPHTNPIIAGISRCDRCKDL